MNNLVAPVPWEIVSKIIPSPSTCAYCGTKFYSSRKRQKCCSLSCANRLKWSNPEYKAKVLVKTLPLLAKSREIALAKKKALHTPKPHRTRAEYLEFMKWVSDRWNKRSTPSPNHRPKKHSAPAGNIVIEVAPKC